MPQAFLDALEQEFGFTTPTKRGLDSVDAVRGMYERGHHGTSLGAPFIPAVTPNAPLRPIRPGGVEAGGWIGALVWLRARAVRRAFPPGW